MKRICQDLCLSLFAVSLASAGQLAQYRAEYQKPASKTAAAEAAKRVAALSAALVVGEHPSLTAVRATLSSYKKARTQSSSGFIRDVFLKKARQFKEEDQYSRPSLFEPSSTLTMEQVDAKNKARFTAFCKREFGPNLLGIAQQYDLAIIKNTARAEAKENLAQPLVLQLESYLKDPPQIFGAQVYKHVHAIL